MPVTYSSSLEAFFNLAGGDDFSSLSLDHKIFLLMMIAQQLATDRDSMQNAPINLINLQVKCTIPDVLIILEKLTPTIRTAYQNGEGQSH